ncbi:MAG: Fe2+-dependent dioxygenase [Chromatiales bacterium]|nr:Fe2+-dependent dioxygenase [Chromatiales bacterium]
MLLEIPEILAPAAVGDVVAALAGSQFVDGRATAGKAARTVKRNEEGQLPPQQMQNLYRLIITALAQSPRFRSAALPLSVSDPIFARYRPGMTYGDHIDDPVMGAGKRFRSDIAVTVFLNEPDRYDGGELVVRTSFGDRRVKLAAGHAVVYPASSLHQVAPVTRGERIVAVCWVQSMVRSPEQRELLYELDLARESLLEADPNATAAQQVNRAYLNLIRMWAEV